MEQLELKLSLMKAIDSWIDEHSEDDAFMSIGWKSENLCDLMTNSAFGILETTKDVNDYLQKEGLLKN